MPVLGIVLTLHDQLAPRDAALAFLSSRPDVDLGEIVRGRLPAVLSTDSRAEDKALWNAIEALSGVTHIELISADFSDLTAATPSRRPELGSS